MQQGSRKQSTEEKQQGTSQENIQAMQLGTRQGSVRGSRKEIETVYATKETRNFARVYARKV